MNGALFLILVFLGVSILFYVLFGGADFGAGILELFLWGKKSEDKRKLITHSIAPVWEANHVWLILAVVILFMGFPSIYTTLSIYLHLPLIAVLVGIVLRGSAFTFRHYDTYTRQFHPIYTATFAFSSLWTSFFLGTLGGALFLGKITPDAQDYYTLYVAPWFNPFCIVLGVFLSSLFTLLASVYLTGETEDKALQKYFRSQAFFANCLLILLGPLVFITAELQGLPLIYPFLKNPISISCLTLATFLLIPFWTYLRAPTGKTTVIRLIGAAIVSFIMLGWFAVQYPIAIRVFKNEVLTGMTFEQTASPTATLQALLGALVCGIMLIFPALGYLFKIFKWQTFDKKRTRI